MRPEENCSSSSASTLAVFLRSSYFFCVDLERFLFSTASSASVCNAVTSSVMFSSKFPGVICAIAFSLPAALAPILFCPQVFQGRICRASVSSVQPGAINECSCRQHQVQNCSARTRQPKDGIILIIICCLPMFSQVVVSGLLLQKPETNIRFLGNCFQRTNPRCPDGASLER